MSDQKEHVTIVLNGKKVQAPVGSTVMEVATREKVAIPHFCWHPGLSVAGVCRFCMVKVEGRPKLEIACNLPVSEGLVVATQTDEVKNAHKWALEFHLANHPLDCPVCDQAGECSLQDYYMSVGKYKSQMEEPKVLKPKAMDVGSELILDTERCILCSRCVRFEDEVTKTGGLGIFDRGDSSIIGTFKEEKITHKYQENLVDICPVGAFTSKKFRFKQRVWFLKEKESICPGCSTGCSIKVHSNDKKGEYFRIKPNYDEAVNDHWMCDYGRTMVDHMNIENRLTNPMLSTNEGFSIVTIDKAISGLAEKISSVSIDDVCLLISPQYTCEEYRALFEFFIKELSLKHVFIWRSSQENIEDFDGVLLRGDKSSNSVGMLQELSKLSIEKTSKNEFMDCVNKKAKVTIAVTPEIVNSYASFDADLSALSKLDYVSVWSTASIVAKFDKLSQVIPLKCFAEKTGTFVNYAGKSRNIKESFDPIFENVHDIKTISELLSKKLLG